MKVIKTRDPAGVLPDRVRVELDGRENSNDVRTVAALLEGSGPSARIARLRRHPELIERADELNAMFIRDGKADHFLLMLLAQAEYKALYLDAKPVAITGKKVRQPREASNAQRKAASQAQYAEWQRLADETRAKPQHAKKTKVNIARLIAKPGENWDTIRKNIK